MEDDDDFLLSFGDETGRFKDGAAIGESTQETKSQYIALRN
jgi:hypothetical protein